MNRYIVRDLLVNTSDDFAELLLRSFNNDLPDVSINIHPLNWTIYFSRGCFLYLHNRFDLEFSIKKCKNDNKLYRVLVWQMYTSNCAKLVNLFHEVFKEKIESNRFSFSSRS
jgi:hypothetical protein